MSNELKHESSPYLLQHAENPVFWKAWNSAALEEAVHSRKLIIISIGYSACHWCHVMEHETFEDEEAAAVMNESFINIKVDREERPDVDAVYMKAVQIMTGRGGWPMNVVALPDGRPVWGGTYFRKQEWMDTLEELQQMYQATPEKLVAYAEKLHEAMNSISLAVAPLPGKTPVAADPDADPLQQLEKKWALSFDHDFGGMARAPKFMMPSNYSFLMRYATKNQDIPLMDFVNLTLTKMAYGGLFDPVGGGFSRYSVDMHWHVPHFEKMLYDNAQLVSLYAKAYRRTKNELYREVVEKTLSFINTEFDNGQGGFYAALDADSRTAEGILEEGAFYIWTKPELQELLGADFQLFAEVFNINPFGHWEHENYVLIRTKALNDIATQFGITEETLRSKKLQWESVLYERRELRQKPRLDDKCLTSWNAMALTAFIHAYNALQIDVYLETAKRSAAFIKNILWQRDGSLFHTYKNGHARINGYLEDYAHVIEAFINLYQATLDENTLIDARQLTDYCIEHFYDAPSGFFSFTSQLDSPLVSAHFETEDNVIPASNSVMAANLHKLGIYFNNPAYTRISEKMTHQVVQAIDYPSAFSNWMEVHLDHKHGVQLAITGPNVKTHLTAIHKQYLPDLLVAGTASASEIPFLIGKSDSLTDLYYVCRDQTCSLASDDFDDLTKKLSV